MPDKPRTKRKLSNFAIRRELLAKLRELIKKADTYAELGEDAWMMVYLRSAASLAKAISENYPQGVSDAG